VTSEGPQGARPPVATAKRGRERGAVTLRNLAILLPALALALLGLRAGCAALWWSGSINYAERQPSQVFEFVLGTPVPKGVTDLRVSGRSYFAGLKHWVYISFDASDAALRQLATDVHRVSGDYKRHLLVSRVSTDDRFDGEDQQAVGWEAVRRIRDPEVFEAGHSRDSFVWITTFVVDRPGHRVYVKAWGD
jgi:hypothetical protein